MPAFSVCSPIAVISVHSSFTIKWNLKTKEFSKTVMFSTKALMLPCSSIFSLSSEASAIENQYPLICSTLKFLSIELDSSAWIQTKVSSKHRSRSSGSSSFILVGNRIVLLSGPRLSGYSAYTPLPSSFACPYILSGFMHPSGLVS